MTRNYLKCDQCGVFFAEELNHVTIIIKEDDDDTIKDFCWSCKGEEFGYCD